MRYIRNGGFLPAVRMAMLVGGALCGPSMALAQKAVAPLVVPDPDVMPAPIPTVPLQPPPIAIPPIPRRSSMLELCPMSCQRIIFPLNKLIFRVTKF